MTLSEAADYLRLSRSSLYQRKDIPRYRIPGSRQVRFLRHELIRWLKGETPEPSMVQASEVQKTLDSRSSTVYHRNPNYR